MRDAHEIDLEKKEKRDNEFYIETEEELSTRIYDLVYDFYTYISDDDMAALVRATYKKREEELKIMLQNAVKKSIAAHNERRPA